MMLNNLNELHGKKSKCGKFTINIDKEFIAVACNFHDGKDRIVYSEPIDNMDTVMCDLYRVWNFPQYKIIEDKPVSNFGYSILVGADGTKLAVCDREGNKIRFSRWYLYEVFDTYDNWDDFTSTMVEKHGCNIVDI